jgi:abhydrolase domain-containing protein 13
LHLIIEGMIINSYGKSTGVPSERGMELDCECIMEYLLKCKTIDNTKIYVLGRSLGGAFAIYIADKFKFAV